MMWVVGIDTGVIMSKTREIPLDKNVPYKIKLFYSLNLRFYNKKGA